MAVSRSRTVLHRIALIAFVLLLATGIALRDPEAIAFAVGTLVGIMLLAFRNGLLGRIVLALIFLDTGAWMAPAAFSNVRHEATLLYVAVPVALAAVALAGIVAAVGIGSRLIPLLILVVAAGAVGASRVPSIGDHVTTRSGDVVISVKNVKFSHTDLTAKAGKVSVRFTNHDLFWHTFTIDSPDVDLRVPVGATRRVSFTAAPGTYEFYCRIPGHKSAGMHGTLTVR
jgi:plastocyanin